MICVHSILQPWPAGRNHHDARMVSGSIVCVSECRPDGRG